MRLEGRPVLSCVDGTWHLTDKANDYHRELTTEELRHLACDLRDAVDLEAEAVAMLEARIRDGLVNGNVRQAGHTPHSTMKAIVVVRRWFDRHREA